MSTGRGRWDAGLASHPKDSSSNCAALPQCWHFECWPHVNGLGFESTIFWFRVESLIHWAVADRMDNRKLERGSYSLPPLPKCKNNNCIQKQALSAQMLKSLFRATSFEFPFEPRALFCLYCSCQWQPGNGAEDWIYLRITGPEPQLGNCPGHRTDRETGRCWRTDWEMGLQLIGAGAGRLGQMVTEPLGFSPYSQSVESQ